MRHLVWIALALGVTLSGQAQVERRPDGFPYLSHGRYWFVKNFTRSLQDLTVHSDMKQGDSTILAALHPTAGEALPLITPTTAKDVKVFHVFENSKCAFVVYSLGSTSNSRFAILKKNRPEATDALVRASEGKDLPFCEAKNFNKPFQEDTWIVFPVNSKLNIGFMNPNIDAIAAEAERRRFTPGETFAFFTKNYYLGEPFSTKEKEIIRWVFGTEDVGEGLFIRQEAQMDPNSLAGFEGWDPKDFLDEGDKFYPWYSLDIFGDNVRFFWENQYIAPDPGVTPDLAIIYLSEMGDRAWRAHFDVPPDGAVWLDRQKSFALENSYIVISDNFLFLLIHEKPFSGKNPYTKERTILIFHTDEHINYTALEAGDLKVKDYHWKFVDGVRILDTNTAQPFSPADLHLNDGSAGLISWANSNPSTASLPNAVAMHIARIIQEKVNDASPFHNWSGSPAITDSEIIHPFSAAGKEEILQSLFYSNGRFDLRSFGRYTLGLPSVLLADCYVKRESEYDQNSHTSTSIYRLSDLEWLSNFYVGAGAYTDKWKDADNRSTLEDFFDESNAGVLSKSWFVVTGDFLFLGIVQDGLYVEDIWDAFLGIFTPPKNNFFVLGVFYCPDGVNTDDLWFGKRSLRSYKWQFVDAFRHASIFLEEVHNTPEELHLSQGLGAFLDWLALNPNYPAPYQTGKPVTIIDGAFYSYSYGNSIAWHLGQIIQKINQNKANARPWNEGLSAHNWTQNLSHNNNSVNTSLPDIFQYSEGSTDYFDIRNFVQAARSNRNQAPPYYLASSTDLGATAWKNHFGITDWNDGKDGYDLGSSWILAVDTLLLVVINDQGSQKSSISYNLFHTHTPVDVAALRSGTKKLKDYSWIYIDGFKRIGSPDDEVNIPIVDVRWLFEKGFSSVTAWTADKPTCPAPRQVFDRNWNLADNYICPIAWHLGRVIANFSANPGKIYYYTGWSYNLVQTSASISPVVATAADNLPQGFFVEKAVDGSYRYNLLPFIDAAVKRR